ncbi:MAG: HAD hydrolase-like protein [Pseudomonadota bacterium]
MFRNLLSLTRRLAPNSRFFSHSELQPYLDFCGAWKRILEVPVASRVQGVNFDIGGTIADQYCIAPFSAFKDAFSAKGFELTEQQILGPMGMSKIKHIEHLLNDIKEQFYKKYGRVPGQHDVNEFYAAFLLLLPESIKQRTQLTPDTETAVNFILQSQIKLALTSGYPRVAADLASKEFRKLFPRYVSATADETDGSRIAMIRQNNRNLDVAMSNSVFFTDSPYDISNTRSDGSCWVIGIYGSSVCMNITSARVAETISEEELIRRREQAKFELEKCSPHAVISDMRQLPFAIASVCEALHKGLKPETTKRITIEFPEAKPNQASGRRYT